MLLLNLQRQQQPSISPPRPRACLCWAAQVEQAATADDAGMAAGGITAPAGHKANATAAGAAGGAPLEAIAAAHGRAAGKGKVCVAVCCASCLLVHDVVVSTRTALAAGANEAPC